MKADLQMKRWLAVIMIVQIGACQKNDQAVENVAEQATVSESTVVTENITDVAPVTSQATSPVSKRAILDTRITPDMIRELQFHNGATEAVVAAPEKPFNLNPQGTTRVSVTPQFMMKEDQPDIKNLNDLKNYKEYLDGAEINVEVQFE